MGLGRLAFQLGAAGVTAACGATAVVTGSAVGFFMRRHYRMSEEDRKKDTEMWMAIRDGIRELKTAMPQEMAERLAKFFQPQQPQQPPNPPKPA